MSFDINRCTFSGKVGKFKRVDTRTGTPMITFRLKCWKELIKVAGFKELAEDCVINDGDQVKIKGRLQSSSWEYEGVRYRSFQIVADEIEVLKEEQPVQKKKPTELQKKSTRIRRPHEPEHREPVHNDGDTMPF